MTTQTKLITADELLLMPDDGYRYELIRGVLIRKMPPGRRHGNVAACTAAEFVSYVRDSNYGSVNAEIGYKLESVPDTVRAPDVSWIAPESDGGLIPGYQDGAPDLAVEVKSPNDSRPEMFAKAQMWIGYGTRIVLVLDPALVTVTVYRPNTEPVTYGEDDVLDLGDLLPRFSCPVWRLFRQQR